MKKIFLLLFTVICSLGAHAQAGDLFVGATGGYITSYQNVLYGINAAYHVTDPLEISFTGLMNPNINDDENSIAGENNSTKIKMYSTNFDIRYYIILQRNWAMGPFIGGQYSYLDKKYINSATNEQYSLNVAGFNIGWQLRANLTENIKLNGGWRYTSANHNASHHLFYIGLGYTFNLF